MAKKLKTRDEIDNKYKWDLSTIYISNEDWEKDYNKVLSLSQSLAEYKGHVLDSADNLYNAINDYFSIMRLLDKVYVYAHLLHDEEMSIEEPEVMYKKGKNAYKDINTLMSYLEPELLKHDYSKIEEFYQENPKLLDYKRYLVEVYRGKAHTLSENEEAILSQMKSVQSNPSETFEVLTDIDMKFDNIKDEKGEEVEFNESNYPIYSRSNDRRVRHDAFTSLYKGYENIINTLTSTLSGQVNAEVAEAKIRKFKSTIEAALYSENISLKVYDSLIEAVNANLDKLHKYYKLRKDMMEVEELHLYDMNNEIIPETNKKYTFEEAKDLVLKALAPLGEEYISDLSQAFDQKWIDVYPNKNKASGAYSSGCYDTFPYALLNFKGTFDNVRTLAHELGHSMHSYYSRKFNTYQDSSYEIFVAEVASTVNELLLFNYVYNNTIDEKEKLSLLDDWITSFKGTVFRQTMFAEFEKDIYEKVENGDVLTRDYMCNLWLELNKKYFGDSVYVDEEVKHEWARIPHFYYFFYVYKYATGKSAACCIASNILSGKEDAVKEYLEFLKSGGRDYPIEELKIAGVDMNSPEVVNNALQMFGEYVKEFEKCGKQLTKIRKTGGE